MLLLYRSRILRSEVRFLFPEPALLQELSAEERACAAEAWRGGLALEDVVAKVSGLRAAGACVTRLSEGAVRAAVDELSAAP